MAGLLQGNPYYSGPSPMAAGVNAFADNFMRGTEFFQKQDEAKLQQQMMQAKLNEYQNEQKMRDEMTAYQNSAPTGLMATPGAAPKQVPFAPQAVPEELQGVQPGAMVDIPGAAPQAAQPGRSEMENLQGMMAIVSKYNPEKGLALRSQLQSATSKAELNQALLDFKIAGQEAKNQYMNELMGLKAKMAEDAVARAKETERHNKETELIAAVRASKGGEGGGKGTEFDRDYKDYSDWFDSTTGNKNSPSYNPGVQKFSRGAYREHKVRQEAGAKTQGQMEGIRSGMGGGNAQVPPPSPTSGGPKKMVWNPSKGRFE
jgi:hypothetical protein